MFTDKNPFGSHPVSNAYDTFKDHITSLVTSGKMDHTTAAEHFNTLNNFASENQHAKAQQYINDHSEKLGFKPKEAWFKDEKWGK